MAISFISGSGYVSGTTTLSVPYPSGIQSGDLLVLFVTNKYPTNAPATPSGFIAPSNNQYSGGAGTAGADSGDVYITVFTRIADATETGNLSVSIPSANSSIGAMALMRKSASMDWEVVCVGGSDNSAGTSWSVTAGSNPGITAGDYLLTESSVNTDSYTFSAYSLTASGATISGVAFDQDSTLNGDDCATTSSLHTVDSGTASAAPVYTMTASGSDANSPAGATVIVRLREVAQGSTYTLTAEAGSFALTGVTTGLKADRNVSATAGAFILTGVNTGLIKAHMLGGNAGAFILGGIDAAVNKGYSLIANAGSFTFTGIDAAIRYNRKLLSGVGAFVLSGQTTVLAAARNLSVAAGSFLLTGNGAGLNKGYTLVCNSGAYILTGQGAVLKYDRVLVTSVGVFVLTGNAATLTYSNATTVIISINLRSPITTSITLISPITTTINLTSKITTSINLKSKINGNV